MTLTPNAAKSRTLRVGVSERITAPRPARRQREVFAPGGVLDQPGAEITRLQSGILSGPGVGHGILQWTM